MNDLPPRRLILEVLSILTAVAIGAHAALHMAREFVALSRESRYNSALSSR